MRTYISYGVIMLRATVLTIFLILPLIALGQESKTEEPTEIKTDPWETLSFLEGTWTGTGDGMSGTSTVEVKFEFVLGGKFLKVTTRSVFEPQEKNPKGEVHEDIGFISYNQAREVFVFRAFYIEGFVNTYVLSENPDDGNTLTFITEHVEGGPPGTKAKLVFTKKDDGSLEEGFFVAFGGQEYGCFSTNQLTKQ